MNLKIWNEIKQPPADALKTIGAGRLKGMTDIKPQWRIKAMTELFGPCGIGWKYTVDNIDFRFHDTGESVVFAHVSLFYKHDGEWSEAVPGAGGARFVANESKGLYVSDEAVKMAITDALSTSMKYLGMASDVYMGLWDGSKYKEPQPDHRFKPGEKEEVVKQVLQCLTDGDGEGLKQIFSEYESPEEKMKVWALFNSQQRAAIKELTA